MKIEKVFISQPMKGLTKDQIKQNRQKLIDSLAVSNPNFEIIDSVLNLDEIPNCKNRRVYCLGESIKLLSQADKVIFMAGWENADGCRMEHEIAKTYGIPVLFQID